MSLWSGPYVSQLGTDFRDEQTVLSTCFHNHPHSANFKHKYDLRVESIQTLNWTLNKLSSFTFLCHGYCLKVYMQSIARGLVLTKHCQRHSGSRSWLHDLELSHKLKSWPLRLQICPPGGATCISCKLGHQVAQHELIRNVVIRWRHLFELPYWHYQLVLSWYLHQPESHQISLKKMLYWLTHSVTSGPIDRTPGLPGSDKNMN